MASRSKSKEGKEREGGNRLLPSLKRSSSAFAIVRRKPSRMPTFAIVSRTSRISSVREIPLPSRLSAVSLHERQPSRTSTFAKVNLRERHRLSRIYVRVAKVGPADRAKTKFLCGGTKLPIGLGGPGPVPFLAHHSVQVFVSVSVSIRSRSGSVLTSVFSAYLKRDPFPHFLNKNK